MQILVPSSLMNWVTFGVWFGESWSYVLLKHVLEFRIMNKIMTLQQQQQQQQINKLICFDTIIIGLLSIQNYRYRYMKAIFVLARILEPSWVLL